MSKSSTCIVGRKVPMDLGLPIVPGIFPGDDVALHSCQIGNSPIQALPVQSAKLYLRHIEPATVPGQIMDFEAFRQPPGFLRFKCLVEGGRAVRIQVIHDQRTRTAFG